MSSEQESEKLYLDWKKIEELVEELFNKIKPISNRFGSISTITRGGLVPSRLLADRLNIKSILVDQEKIPTDSLFVDDIFDSGDTFAKILPKAQDSEKLVFATLVARRGKSLPKQLLYAQLTQGNEAIVFPWDRFEYGIE